MVKTINKKLIRFYLWAAIGMLFIGVMGVAGDYPGILPYIILNNTWVVIYITILNFSLFENSIPFVFKKRRTVMTNILLWVLLLFLYVLLYSYGLYVWRL